MWIYSCEHAGLSKEESAGCMHPRHKRRNNAANLCNKVCTIPTVAQTFTEATCLSMNAVCLSFDGAEGIGTSAPELELSATTGMTKYYK